MCRLLTFLFFALLILTSCGSTPVPESENSTPTAAGIQQPLNSLTHTPMQDSTATVTILPGPILYPTPGWKMETNCIQITDQRTSWLDFSGKLILSGENKVYMLDLVTETLDPFPTSQNASVGTHGNDFMVSPDNTWMAYIESYTDASGNLLQRRLRLIDAESHRLVLSEWNPDWQWIVSWIDDQTLALWLPNQNDGTITIMNPFTIQSQELLLSFAFTQNKNFSSSWYIWGQPLVYYNASLTKAIYPDKKGELVLWDTQTQNELWRGSTTEYTNSNNAQWTSDGENLIVVTAIDHNEKLVWINLKSRQTEEIPFNLFVNIESFSISPNGSLVAVWASTDPYGFQERSLFLVDISTHTVMNTCLTSERFQNKPIWSPDSTVIATAMKNDSTNNVVIISEVNHYAYALLVNRILEPVGWLRDLSK